MPFENFKNCFTFCSQAPAIYRKKKFCPLRLNVLLRLKINNKCMNKKKKENIGCLQSFCNGKIQVMEEMTWKKNKIDNKISNVYL